MTTTSQEAPASWPCCQHCEVTARFVPAMTCQTPDQHTTPCPDGCQEWGDQ